MSEELPEMPFLRNIGFIVTYRCQVACPHCIIEAGPNRKEEMSLNKAFDWIKQVAEYRDGYVRVLSLTGGEPFYDVNKLRRIATLGERCNLLVSAVTNAFWAKTKDEAVRVLRSIPAIRMIAISTDVYHQESIPFDRVRNAVSAAKECDIPYNISVCTENENDQGFKDVMADLLDIADQDTINVAVTFPAGRALKKLGTMNYQTTNEPPVSACSAGSSPIIFPDGRVVACIGPIIDLPAPHPLVLGNLEKNSLEEILEKAEVNPILHSIRIWGPKKLVSILKEAGLDRHLPKEYVKDSVCCACYCLMSEVSVVDFLGQLAAECLGSEPLDLISDDRIELANGFSEDSDLVE